MINPDGTTTLATTPDVPRGHFWNHNGTIMLGYWDLLDAYERAEILRRRLIAIEKWADNYDGDIGSALRDILAGGGEEWDT